MAFNPVELATETKKIVCKNTERKYYRFRAAKFYGGIATADCVGCNLRCAFCWAWNTTTKPETVVKFYTPEEVAQKLLTIAKEKKIDQIRISGNEPTIGRDHLLLVLKNLEGHNVKFILETNGIFLSDKSYALDLARFKDFLHVRISIKGATPDEFSQLTGAVPEAFELPIQALKNLVRAGVPCHPAVMVSFSNSDSIRLLHDRLETISPSFYDFEEEELILYGAVQKRLEKAGIKWTGAHEPEKIPNQLI